MSQVVYQLSLNNLAFPSPDLALTDPNGLLAIGGNLSTQRLINAYSNGIFPWYSEGEPIMWWAPTPRAIIPTADVYINKTLKKQLKKSLFKVSINQAFNEVIAFCADAPFRKEGTWIIDEMVEAYQQLHQQGIAHSIEVWQGNNLVGGLYGVAINGFFSGESMFYAAPNASKVALVAAANYFKNAGITFIDCQINNPFLASMGSIEIGREAFSISKQAMINLVLPSNFWSPKYLPISYT